MENLQTNYIAEENEAAMIASDPGELATETEPALADAEAPRTITRAELSDILWGHLGQMALEQGRKPSNERVLDGF